jgi:hypothetical protein
MDDEYNDYDEGSWPPAKYPAREAFTMSLCFVALVGFVGWMIWKLI